MTLKEAIESKMPFKSKTHVWWHNPDSYPTYLDAAKEKNWRGDTWELGSFEELREQEKQMEKYFEDLKAIENQIEGQIKVDWK